MERKLDRVTCKILFSLITRVGVGPICEERGDESVNSSGFQWKPFSCGGKALSVCSSHICVLECAPLATEPGISLIILTSMKILQRNLNRSTFVV